MAFRINGVVPGDSDEPRSGGHGAPHYIPLSPHPWIPAFAGMTKSGDWYGELAGRIPPPPTATRAGDEPLASRSLRPRYIRG